MGNETFKVLLNRIAGQFPSRAALAKALGITASRVSRALNTGDFPLNIENCLRLAQLSGESPGMILRAADKEKLAALIESLYGSEAQYTATEQEIINTWRTLAPKQKEAVQIVMNDMAVRQVEKRKRRAS